TGDRGPRLAAAINMRRAKARTVDRPESHDCRDFGHEPLYAHSMSLRIYPISAARWAQLAGTRLPIDLTERNRNDVDRARQVREEHDRIREHVAKLLAERATKAASRSS